MNTTTTNPTIFMSDNVEGAGLTTGWSWSNNSDAELDDFQSELWTESFKHVFEAVLSSGDVEQVDVVIMAGFLEDVDTDITLVIHAEKEDFHLPHAVAYRVDYLGKKSGVLFQDTKDGEWGEEHGDLESFSGGSWFFLPEDCEDVAADSFSENMGAMIEHVARTAHLLG